MDNKILAILLDMQTDIKNMQVDLKDANNKLDKIEFKMKDGFETLEILSKDNFTELSKVKVKVSKLEKRVLEMSIIN